MRIITQAIRVIDYEEGQVFAREIMPEFGEYIRQLVSYIQTNTSVREYRTQSDNTEVIQAVVDIVKHPSDEETVGQDIDRIADRLLQKESEAQELVGRMGVSVQKGSLILALVEKDGNTRFLLAKVESFPSRFTSSRWTGAWEKPSSSCSQRARRIGATASQDWASFVPNLSWISTSMLMVEVK